MLTGLLIKNYALIKHLEIAPGKGLNIITGETGAGKSIMLGALGLLMGNRADTKALYSEDEKCFVEGSFDIKNLNLKGFFDENDLEYEDICVIRREISPAGKSRAFVNDSPVTLEILKPLGEFLMDIHSQHDTIQLGSNTYQLSILDAYAQNLPLLEEFKESYVVFRKVEKKLVQLKDSATQFQKELDYNSFLLEELKSLRLENFSQEELEEELLELENAEEVKRRLSQSFDFLNNSELSGLQLVKEAGLALGFISQISDKYKSLKERLQSTLIELQDISGEIERIEGAVEVNEDRTIEVKDSLNLLYKLQQKHGVKTVAELLVLQADFEEKVNTVANLSEEIAKLEKEKAAALEKVKTKVEKLSKSRVSVIGKFEKNIEVLLHELGMPDAQIKITSKIKELGADGQDEITFEFSANKGLSPKSLKEVASGGEFSRLMLALKYILAEKRALPTIIFDEIDTGISGEVAIKVGKMMDDMAKNIQVVAITHLHQIAGRGQTHFYVYKDNSDIKTVSLMKKLSHDERINELAKMIGGQNPSESAIQSAKEMLVDKN